MNKSDIIKWYHKYNDTPGNDNESESKILSRINSILTWDEFKSLVLSPNDGSPNDGILKWKLALRTIRYYDSLNPSKWKDLFEIIKCSKDDPKNTVKNIRDFSRNNMSYNGKKGGISYPVASTLVYFFSEGQCPIIDWRAISALKDNGYGGRLKNVYTDDGWDRYFDLCKNLVKNLEIEKIGEDTPLRVLDKALWEYPDLNKTERKKEVCC